MTQLSDVVSCKASLPPEISDRGLGTPGSTPPSTSQASACPRSGIGRSPGQNACENWPWRLIIVPEGACPFLGERPPKWCFSFWVSILNRPERAPSTKRQTHMGMSCWCGSERETKGTTFVFSSADFLGAASFFRNQLNNYLCRFPFSNVLGRPLAA